MAPTIVGIRKKQGRHMVNEQGGEIERNCINIGKYKKQTIWQHKQQQKKKKYKRTDYE